MQKQINKMYKLHFGESVHHCSKTQNCNLYFLIKKKYKSQFGAREHHC
jgi:hypothetical protein